MESAEIERELEDIETRIDRLRALYEQYFMGIEKLEPLIQRKDVDRRFWLLRRVQIRNTALRFKFQTLVQRFNTFQQYWQRVSREIESGTYRRDVLRAASRVGEKEALTIVSRRRAGQYAKLLAAQKERLVGRAGGRREATEPPPPAAEDVDVVWSESEVPPPQVSAPTEGSVARPAPVAPDPVAARQRVAALAAQMRVDRAVRAPEVPTGPLDLDLDLDGLRKSTAPPKRSPPDAVAPRAVAPRIPPAPRTPSVSEGGAPRAPAAAKVFPGPLRPASRVAEPAEIPDQRLRQIYARYIEAKRAANESTAGITYDKLAQSLRAQAAQLRASHVGKSVDYEVVVKDGRPLLKPIVR
jgi:hypothetical protein